MSWIDTPEVRQMHSDIANEMWDALLIVCNKQSMKGTGRFIHDNLVENMGDLRIASGKSAFQIYRSAWPGLPECFKSSRNVGRLQWDDQWFEIERITDRLNNYLHLSVKACPYDPYCRADTCNVDCFGPNISINRDNRRGESHGDGDRSSSGGRRLTRDSRPHRERGY